MNRRVVTLIAGLTAITSLSACGASPDANAEGSATTTGAASSSSAPPTVTVTITRTGATPAPSSSSPGKPNPTMTVPPAAKDPAPIPSNARDYATAFVAAWVARDRPRATQLGTSTAVATAFASTVTVAPSFTGCEGAAGSSYCTWQGEEYTMTVRVMNDAASNRQPHAVIEVRFAH